MRRLKVPEATPPARPSGNWLAGVMIGSAIMTMAAQAIMLGTTAAIRDSALKEGW
jgi:hypothetical protein